MFVKFLKGTHDDKELWLDLSEVIAFYKCITDFSDYREEYYYTHIELKSGRFIEVRMPIEEFTKILQEYDPGRFEESCVEEILLRQEKNNA